MRRQAYDIFVRGGLGPEPEIGRLALPARADRRARRGGRGPDRAAGSTRRSDGESVPGVLRAALTDDELGALAGLEPAKKRRRDDEEVAGVSTYRADRRAGGRRAVDRVRGRGAAGRARVGDRARSPAHRDLDGVPDRQRRADRHGLRDRPGRSRSSASTPAGCRPRRSSSPTALRDALPGPQPRAARARRRPRSTAMIGKHGVDLFKTRVDLRLLCCNVRKVRPLTKHLAHARRLDHRPAPRPVGEPHEHPQGRDRPRPRRDREAEPARRVDEDEVWDYVARARRARTTRSTTRATRRSAARPCTRAIDAGRGEPRRPLVVGDERAEGVRHPLLDRERRPRARAARDPRRDAHG